MKKIIFILAIFVLCLTGCGKLSDSKLKKEFIGDVSKLKSYYMEGILNLTNNDDTYNYDVKVSYEKDDKYKVVLLNKANNYEQTILKNEDGVYVITPSLNKSFKFQSDWPNNNSQVYLLHSLASDLENDKNYEFEQKNDDYIFTTKVNYPNNNNLVKQKITFNNDMELKKVEVLNKDNIPYITFTVKDLDLKAKFNDDYFDLDTLTENFDDKNNEDASNNDLGNNQNNDVKDDDTKVSVIDESVFPLYVPVNTTLSNKEVIDTTNGQRIIMTFAGDSPFIFVQETVAKEEEFTIIPTYGEPFMLTDTIGSLTDASYTWTSNGIEYYIVSDVLAQEELLEVAKSINVISAMNEK